MNNGKERAIIKLLSKELGEIKLSQQSKRHITDNMAKSLAYRKLPLRKRLVIGLREFWHSTFEISVAPAALTGAAAVMLVFLTVYPGLAPIDKPLNSETVYVQSVIEQNGTQTVVYLPVEVR